MKRLSFFIAVLLVINMFSIAPTTVFANALDDVFASSYSGATSDEATADEVVGDITYRFCSDGTARVKSYEGSDSVVEIPENVKNHKVTAVCSDAFYECDYLEKVTLPDSILEIGSNAFDSCTSLKTICLGNSVTRIGAGAFSGCERLKSINIPKSVTKIGSYAFFDCENLKTITGADNVTQMGEGAFDNTLWFENQPYSVVYIGKTAYQFKGENYPKQIVIKSGTVGIGESAFYCCSNLTSVILPDTVETIGKCAFSDCDKLAEIVIPSSVTSIGRGAFDYCNKLADVYYMGSETGWNEISIGADNSALNDADIVFNYTRGKANKLIIKTTVTLPKNKGIVFVNGTLKIKAFVKNANGLTTFTSSNPKVATVNSKGVVKGIKAGKATISVCNNDVVKKFSLTVANPTLSTKKATLEVGEKLTLKVNGKVGKAKFKSSKKKVATVNKKGLITAKKKGSAKIIVTTNGNIKLSCKVKVK
ncbi:MAG: leucine-rich repeat protein [Ruminococcus sp.]